MSLKELGCKWKGHTLVGKYGEVYGEVTPTTGKVWTTLVLLGDDWYEPHPPATSKKEARTWVEQELLQWRTKNPMAFEAQQGDMKAKHSPMVPKLVEIPKDLVDEITKYLIKKGCIVGEPFTVQFDSGETTVNYTIWSAERREAQRQRMRAIWAARRAKKAKIDARAKRLKELADKVASGATTLADGMGDFIDEIVGHRNLV